MDNFESGLTELRKSKGLTMKQFADAVRVSEMAISRWESGSRVPNINSVIQLAKYFNVTVGYLVGTEN